ncbi:MAG: aminopeptidase P N-terminal domain-containing protein [Erysipelothrix sp.]|jgi:Xaa-Pro aminopeptidase|nr:aminopeptidase P N-terminal domain-containing protein [Erysipelothrix sp.]
MNQYLTRRKEVAKTLDVNGCFISIANDLIVRSADSHFPFEVNKNFLYLTGINQDDSVLLIIKTEDSVKEMIFIKDIDPVMEKWVGTFLPFDQAKHISGCEVVLPLSSLQSTLNRLVTRTPIHKLYLDHHKNEVNAQELAMDRFMNKMFSNNLIPVVLHQHVIHQMRAIKSHEEVEAIRAAIEVSKNAFEHMLRAKKSLTHEQHIQATLEYIFKMNSASPGFDTIVAAHKRATILHYVENNKKIESNSLILVDMGSKLNHYSSDISRTFPHQQTFTPLQKKAMNVVLDAMEVVFKLCIPGTPLKALNQAVLDFYKVRLVEDGFIKDESEVNQVYYHGVSHFLGLDIHDVGQYDDTKLQAGHVITVEPGLYIESLNLGIRIEDNVLITNNGYENLSQSIMKSVEDIEAFV